MAADDPRRVCLHIGLPKSGTTFLQHALATNRKDLAAAGVLYAGGSDLMFRAALDVRGIHRQWGRKRAEVQGSWDKLCQRARDHAGVTVLGHELLAAASTRQIASAMSMLSGLDVHIVVTARDLARQITAEWQEGVKGGRTGGFEEFRSQIFEPHRSHSHAQKFWSAQELPAVLSRWSSWLPASNVHVVCCPTSSDDPTLLWRRFADALGIPPGLLEPAVGPALNSSLGITQVALLRQVNVALDRRLPQPHYGRVAKHYFAQQLLAAHASPRPRLPAASLDEVVGIAEQWVKAIHDAGYAVHGNLTELVPRPTTRLAPHPDEVDPHQVATTAAAVVADLLLEVDRLRREVAELPTDKKSLKKKGTALKARLAELVSS